MWSAGRSILLCGYLCVCLFTWVLCRLVTIDASELPQLKVTANPRLAYAPADIQVIVIAKPDEKNRYLAVSVGAVDSAFAGSSQRSLDGENERGELANLRYRDVPPGTYMVIAALFDRQGKQLARSEAEATRMPRVTDNKSPLAHWLAR